MIGKATNYKNSQGGNPRCSTRDEISHPSRPISSRAATVVHYILQPIADILEQTELFCRFIDNIVWITDSESTNIGIRSALNTVFKNNGLELTFQQICTNDDSGSVEFLDVNHCIAADSVFGFVTNDLVKPTSVGRRCIHGLSHHPPSTFKSIIFGEAIRLRRLNERKEDCLTSLKQITEQSKKVEISC